MFYSIDRFEGDLAVLIADKDGEQVIVERSHIPADAGEGGILRLQNGQYDYDAEETARRRRAFFQRTRNMSKK